MFCDHRYLISVTSKWVDNCGQFFFWKAHLMSMKVSDYVRHIISAKSIFNVKDERVNQKTCIIGWLDRDSKSLISKDLTHHHDESTLGVKMSSSKIKMENILQLGLEWWWLFVPCLIPIARLLLSDKLRDFIKQNMIPPFMCLRELQSQVWKSATSVCSPSSEG